MTEPAVQCHRLVKRYDDLVAVAGLDLSIDRGECFGMLGPNGAGKTTTIEMLLGLSPPDEGRVAVLGRDWKGDASALRQRIGSQLQETRLPERLTVREVVTLFRSFYRAGREVSEVLAMVRLEEKRDVWVKNLSGGQRQRLSLATALVSDPDVLFLDEPTTGLDPQARLQVWDVIRGFRQRGRTILLTTHYMEEAERLCDRVGIIDQGRLIALGTPGELVASLGAEHVVEIAVGGPPPEDDRRLRALPGVVGVHREGDRIRLTVSRVHEVVPPLLRVLAGEGVELTELSTHHATLEDVFIAHTGRHLRG